jgi:hypothetical protein
MLHQPPRAGRLASGAAAHPCSLAPTALEPRPARLVEGAPGGPLQRRLADEELMLLAEADADPCSACLAGWARGDAAGSVQRLVASLAAAADEQGGARGGPTAGSAGGGSTRLRVGSRLSLVSVGGDAGGYAGAAAAAARGGTDAAGPQRHAGGSQAALLDWLLSVGVRALAGHDAPGLLPVWVHTLALQCARTAEVAGLPLAAAEALAVADAVGDPTAPPATARGQLAVTLDLMWRARLAAACVLLSTTPAAVVAGGPHWQAGDLAALQQRAWRRRLRRGGSGGGGRRAGGELFAPWEALPDPSEEAAWAELLSAALPALAQASGLAADAAAVGAVLRRHAAALRPAAALAPSLGSSAPPHGLPAAAAAASPPLGARRRLSGCGPAPAAAEREEAGAAADGAPAPVAALAICLKRAETDATSSLAGGGGGGSTVSSLMASLPSLRRRASAEATPASGNSPLAAPGSGAPTAGAPLGRVGRAAAGAGSSGAQHGLLGGPWDVAAAEGGDKLRAVVAARGPGYGLAAAGGGGGGAAAGPSAGRPIAFAAQRGGIKRGELAAPAGEDVSPSFRLGASGSGSLLAGLMHQVAGARRALDSVPQAALGPQGVRVEGSGLKSPKPAPSYCREA